MKGSCLCHAECVLDIGVVVLYIHCTSYHTSVNIKNSKEYSTGFLFPSKSDSRFEVAYSLRRLR